MSKDKDEPEKLFLPVTLDVRVIHPNEKEDPKIKEEVEKSLYRAIMDDLQHFRAACRQVFCMMMMAHMAGARIEVHEKGIRLTPNSERSKHILATAMGMTIHPYTKAAVTKALKTIATLLGSLETREKLSDTQAGRLDEMLFSLSDAASRRNWAEDVCDQGAAEAYEMRDWVLNELLPGWEPWVFDGIRRECLAVFNSKDPEFPKATRGWLMMQGARKLAFFNRIGIEFPLAHATPEFGSNTIALQWQKEKVFTFKLMSHDTGRWSKWQAIRDKKAEIGQPILSERDGRIRISIPIKSEGRDRGTDPTRCARVFLEHGEIKTIAGNSRDKVGIAAAVNQMLRLKKQSNHFEASKRPTGSPVKKWGAKKAYRSEADCLRTITVRRTHALQDWNQRWTRRIIDFVVREGCGVLTMIMPAKEEIKLNVPWSWAHFRDCLTYKCARVNVEFKVMETPKEDVTG